MPCHLLCISLQQVLPVRFGIAKLLSQRGNRRFPNVFARWVQQPMMLSTLRPRATSLTVFGQACMETSWAGRIDIPLAAGQLAAS